MFDWVQNMPQACIWIFICSLYLRVRSLVVSDLWGGWKWQWGNKEMPSPFSCSPAIREWLWKKTQIEKKNVIGVRIVAPKAI